MLRYQSQLIVRLYISPFSLHDSAKTKSNFRFQLIKKKKSSFLQLNKPFCDCTMSNIHCQRIKYFPVSSRCVSADFHVEISPNSTIDKPYDERGPVNTVRSYFLSAMIGENIKHSSEKCLRMRNGNFVDVTRKKLTRKSKTLSPSISNAMHMCP